MNITYINHSGFLIEWDYCYWLFDYYKGEIPELKKDKKIFVFVSHNHGDHFNPEIFELLKDNHNVVYVLSSDIKHINENTNKIISVKPSSEYTIQDDSSERILLQTLKSTDRGVAFLLKYQDKTIYYAGDLNLWLWKEETKQYNNNMRANFEKEIIKLKDVFIDVAFAPLDPRQEEWYYMGMESLLTTARVKYAFPMHFWNKPDIVDQFKKDYGTTFSNTMIMDVSEDGQSWIL